MQWMQFVEMKALCMTDKQWEIGMEACFLRTTTTLVLITSTTLRMVHVHKFVNRCQERTYGKNRILLFVVRLTMAQTKHVLKFSMIAEFFAKADERGLITKGENAVESNRIKSFRFAADVRILKAEVLASMRNRTYSVEVQLDSENEIMYTSCTCPRGQHLCHHVAAVCIYGHHNISPTDVECQWSMRKARDEAPKTIEEIYQPKSHRSTDRNLNNEEINTLRNQLHALGAPVGFTWLLQDEPSAQVNLLVDIEELLFSQAYLSTEEKNILFCNTVKVALNTIQNVAEITTGQSKNVNWLTFKKNRLTASNFGVVLAAIGRKRYPPSLFKRLSGAYNLEHVKAVQWGCLNESAAAEQFSVATGLVVVKTGLWLHECGFLGCSPDGFVGDKDIIEIKCPFKYRDKDLKTELRKDKTYVIHLDEDSEAVINKKHEYYAQIQGTLAITQRDRCHLLIWTPMDVLHVEIPRDPAWQINIDVLQQFYLQQYIPFVLGSEFSDEFEAS